MPVMCEPDWSNGSYRPNTDVESCFRNVFGEHSVRLFDRFVALELLGGAPKTRPVRENGSHIYVILPATPLNQKDEGMKQILIIMTAVLLISGQAYGHSGRTDSSGGHNCSEKSKQKGLCSGYHYHGGKWVPISVSSESTPLKSISDTPSTTQDRKSAASGNDSRQQTDDIT
jgi:hypothetical protein